MKMKRLILASATMAAITVFAGPASAQLIVGDTAGAYWNFGSTDALTGPFTPAAENLNGAAQLAVSTTSTATDVGTDLSTFSLSDFTAYDGSVNSAGANFRIAGSSGATTSEFIISGLNLSNTEPNTWITPTELRLNYRINNGANDITPTLDYDIGSGWEASGIALTDWTDDGSWYAVPIDISGLTALNGQEDVSFRFTYPSVTTPGNNVRIDNVQFTGNVAVIPEPNATILIFGSLGALLVLRRRRRATQA